MIFRRNHPAFDDRTALDYQAEWADAELETRKSDHWRENVPIHLEQMTEEIWQETDDPGVRLLAQAYDTELQLVIVSIRFLDWRKRHPIDKKICDEFGGTAGWRIMGTMVRNKAYSGGDINAALEDMQQIIRRMMK